MQLDTIVCGDCVDWLKTLPDNSVDLIATDPPYFKVKSEAWDRQWDKPAQFLAWLDGVAAEWARVLKPNGSLYCFASPRMAARVEVMLAERFNVLNHVVWAKPRYSTKAEMFRKSDLRLFFPSSEAIIFCEHYGADNAAKGEAGYGAKCDELRGFVFEPLRAYLRGEFDRAGIHIGEANVFCGTRSMAARHYFTRSQWCLPTPEHYSSLQRGLNSGCNGQGPQYLRREYEDLRREYEDLRREYEDLRRPFTVSADVPYTDVWTFPTVQAYSGKHSCEKPLAMMEHIVTASSRPAGVVLDCFAGSGTSLLAAYLNDRHYIGCELDPHWADYARARIANARGPLFANLEKETQAQINLPFPP